MNAPHDLSRRDGERFARQIARSCQRKPTPVSKEDSTQGGLALAVIPGSRARRRSGQIRRRTACRMAGSTAAGVFAISKNSIVSIVCHLAEMATAYAPACR